MYIDLEDRVELIEAAIVEVGELSESLLIRDEVLKRIVKAQEELTESLQALLSRIAQQFPEQP